ncbi:diguanylate cyclase (GGDEF)-like protein [Actinoplanes tereljensis]|uniref:GGDEF domain-containing protein n=1 Tax=Paractinoplanes tereljensis TaxID=571912 RepID=A0A919NKG6_9ACTN|nr:GGDEF domain-containing protein [Actinoplanes tereljensis]GIF20395.1 hypothetical protein Ate02nite_31250 [Actinoplanes tereljensis]
MPLLRLYATATAILVAAYALLPAHLNRSWIFLLVTLGVVPAVVIALRRAPAGWRMAWWLLLAAMMLYNIGNSIWIWLVEARGHSTGDGSFAELFLTGGSVLVLGSALVVVVQRGRRDVGGIIDSVITAVALTGILWDAVLLPALAGQDATTGRQVAVFTNVLVMAGTLGALLRISCAAEEQLAPVRLLTLAVGVSLFGNVAGALAVDPATGARADWTNIAYLVAYGALGCAALHPPVSAVTQPGETPVDDLSTARLAYLGTMMALSPLVGGGRVIFELPTDGVLIAISSAALIPLVMIRIARLAGARRRAEQALHRLANSDPLTGLPNRTALVDALHSALAEPADLAVLFCDLDGFKPVNDRLGHAAGDELLIAVADHLRHDLRDGDLVSRFGGDEFVIVTHGADAVEVIADRIRALAARTLQAAGTDVRIGVSVGVAHARPGDTTDDILTRADMAMYEAKKAKTIGTLSLAVG